MGSFWLNPPELHPTPLSGSIARLPGVSRAIGPRHDFTQFWAWQDEGRGIIRARVYANRVGVYEDEACGSASMLLAHRLGRSVTVRHGNGSLIHARPGPDGTVEVGGTVVLDGTREYDMADERRQR